MTILKKALWCLFKVVSDYPKKCKWVPLPGTRHDYINASIVLDFIIDMYRKFLALTDNIERVFYFEDVPNDFCIFSGASTSGI